MTVSRPGSDCRAGWCAEAVCWACPEALSVLQDEQKAEDELAKKRAAFLLKQQRKAEEARVRKQQLEAEVELKRDEAR